jgi:hypothetical protein
LLSNNLIYKIDTGISIFLFNERTIIDTKATKDRPIYTFSCSPQAQTLVIRCSLATLQTHEIAVKVSREYAAGLTTPRENCVAIKHEITDQQISCG